MKLVKLISEIKFATIHDLDKPGVNPDDIKVGDFLQFTVYGPYVETVQQKVLTLPTAESGTMYFMCQDVPGESTDYWTSTEIQTYWKKGPATIDEIKQTTQLDLFKEKIWEEVLKHWIDEYEETHPTYVDLKDRIDQAKNIERIYDILYHNFVTIWQDGNDTSVDKTDLKILNRIYTDTINKVF